MQSLIGEVHTAQDAPVAVGDMVDIVEGIFSGYSGKLAEISSDGTEATVIVSTVGRDMPIKAAVTEIRRKAD